MTHFRFYTNTAPFPGTCVFSGENKNLWEVGSMTVQGQVLPVLLSDRVLVELATQAGFVTGESYASLSASKDAIIEKQKAELSATPQLMEKFSNDVNNLISEFVTGLASVTPARKPVQPKSHQAGPGKPTEDHGVSHQGGSGKIRITKSGTEPTVD